MTYSHAKEYVIKYLHGVLELMFCEHGNELPFCIKTGSFCLDDGAEWSYLFPVSIIEVAPFK